MLFVLQYSTYWHLEFLIIDLVTWDGFNSIARYKVECSRISTYQLVYTAGGSVPKNFISYSTHEQKTIVHISEERVNCGDMCFTLWTCGLSLTVWPAVLSQAFVTDMERELRERTKKLVTPQQQQPRFVILNGFECSRLRSRRFRPWAHHSVFHARAKNNTIFPKQQRHTWVSTANRST